VITAARSARLRLAPAGLAAVLLGAALVAWIVTIARMRGMDAGPGTDLGALGWYVGVWVTMMAAMMLPSAAPTVFVFSRVSAARAGRDAAARSTACFVSGYLVVWALFGLAAYGVFQLIRELDPAFLKWSAQGPIVAGAAVAAAGLYQLSPLKRVCLRHCRSPLHFLMREWRRGPAGAFLAGAEHGGFCAGCCWALMLVLFALGVMSLLWMAVIAAVVFVEKVAPFGWRARSALAVALILLGIWIAASPGSVPGLHEPGEMHMSAPKMQMPASQTQMPRSMR
jgi:predicted metal-binding membrane protein